MADKGDVTIKIPRQLYEKLQTIIADTGFHSVTEFIVYVLRDLVSTDVTSTRKSGQKKEAASPEPNDAGLTAEEIRLIRKRLHDLGYL